MAGAAPLPAVRQAGAAKTALCRLRTAAEAAGTGAAALAPGRGGPAVLRLALPGPGAGGNPAHEVRPPPGAGRKSGAGALFPAGFLYFCRRI